MSFKTVFSIFSKINFGVNIKAYYIRGSVLTRNIHNNKKVLSTNAKFSTNCKLYIFSATACAVGLTWYYKPLARIKNIFKNHDLSLLTPTVVRTEGKYDGYGNKTNVNFIADVVEGAAPAVVYIEIRGRHPYSGNKTTVSNGSGFIVREDGLIMTNAHVVANKESVRVRLHSGEMFDGVVTAVDQVSDLATVKIKGNKLPTLKFGKSSELRPGEWVVALGCPLTLSNTVTAGIVSSVHRGSRELGMHNKDMDYIQTDAVINFGNSGGPLVNMNGEVIGINTMKVTTGIAFAIPSDFANDFLIKAEKLSSQVEKRGSSWFSGGNSTKKKRRYMGITMLTLTPSISMELKERVPDFPDTETGVYVYQIVIGSPCYHGGLRPGDVITHINEQEVLTSKDIYKCLETSDTLRLNILRGEKRLKLSIKTEDIDS